MKLPQYRQLTTFEETISWLICLVASLFYFYEFILRVSASVMVPQLERLYHLSATGLANLNASYYYTYLIMQIPVGILIDRFGPRRPLCFAVLLCVAGTVLVASADHLWLAEAGRALMGCGSAFAFVGVMKLGANWLTPNRIALLAGLVSTLGMLGGALGDLGLTSFLQTEGWRNTMWIMAVSGLVLAAIMWVFVQDQPKKKIYLHSVHITRYSFASVMKDLPMILKSKQIWLCGLIGWMIFSPISVFSAFWGISFLHQAHNLSASSAACLNSMVFIGFAVGSPIAGWLSDYFKNRHMPLIIGAVLALVAVCSVLYIDDLPTWLLGSLLFLFGAFAGAEVVIFAITNEVTERHITATAFAVVNMLVNLGGALLQPLIGFLLDRGWDGAMRNGVPHYSNHDYQMAFSILPIALILTVILTFFLRRVKSGVVVQKTGEV